MTSSTRLQKVGKCKGKLLCQQNIGQHCTTNSNVNQHACRRDHNAMWHWPNVIVLSIYSWWVLNYPFISPIGFLKQAQWSRTATDDRRITCTFIDYLIIQFVFSTRLMLKLACWIVYDYHTKLPKMPNIVLTDKLMCIACTYSHIWNLQPGQFCSLLFAVWTLPEHN